MDFLTLLSKLENDLERDIRQLDDGTDVLIWYKPDDTFTVETTVGSQLRTFTNLEQILLSHNNQGYILFGLYHTIGNRLKPAYGARTQGILVFNIS